MSARWQATKDGDAVMPGRGEPALCADPNCGHIDCEAWREVMDATCPDCGQRILAGEAIEADFVMLIAEIRNLRHAGHRRESELGAKLPNAANG